MKILCKNNQHWTVNKGQLILQSSDSAKLTEDMMKTVGGLLKPGEIESWRGLFDEQKKILLLIHQLL